jgi:hypothetical protein
MGFGLPGKGRRRPPSVFHPRAVFHPRGPSSFPPQLSSRPHPPSPTTHGSPIPRPAGPTSSPHSAARMLRSSVGKGLLTCGFVLLMVREGGGLGVHGGVKIYRGNPGAARAYVEADRSRAERCRRRGAASWALWEQPQAGHPWPALIRLGLRGARMPLSGRPHMAMSEHPRSGTGCSDHPSSTSVRSCAHTFRHCGPSVIQDACRPA